MRPARALLLSLLLALAACDSSDSVAPGLGSIRISLAMTGLDLDPDGALIRLDDKPPVAVVAGAAVTIAAEPGAHRVLLEGLVDNCGVEEGPSRMVSVFGNSQTDLVFESRCVAASGVVQVWVNSQGTDLDPDGYVLAVDDGTPQRVVGGGLVGFAPVSGGIHSLTVSDIAVNCTVPAGNPLKDIQVNTGGQVRDTVRLAVTVTCTSGRGTLLLAAHTSGPADPDGYLVTLGAPISQTFRLAANGSLSLAGLLPGSYPLAVSDIASNCGLSEDPPDLVTVPILDTELVGIWVSCEMPAVLRVAAPTTGSSLDPGYWIRVDGGGDLHALLLEDTLSLDLAPGDHTIALEDVAPNCGVSTPNPVSANLTTAEPTMVTFQVSCTAASRTGFDIIISTTGQDTDAGYFLTLCLGGEDPECMFPVLNRVPVPATGTLQIAVAPNTYYPYLTDVADNCRVTPTGSYAVTDGRVNTIRLDVTCAAFADFVATASVSGEDVPQELYLVVDGNERGYFSASQPTRFASFEGEHTVGLSRMPANCHSVSSNPVKVTLAAGTLTPVAFTVDCESYPIVQISVNSSGANIPSGYVAIIDPDPLDGLHGFYSPLSANGTISTKVYPGSHQVWLDQVPSNCSVSGPNPVSVNGGLGSATQVNFEVTCH